MKLSKELKVNLTLAIISLLGGIVAIVLIFFMVIDTKKYPEMGKYMSSVTGSAIATGVAGGVSSICVLLTLCFSTRPVLLFTMIILLISQGSLFSFSITNVSAKMNGKWCAQLTPELILSEEIDIEGMRFLVCNRIPKVAGAIAGISFTTFVLTWIQFYYIRRRYRQDKESARFGQELENIQPLSYNQVTFGNGVYAAHPGNGSPKLPAVYDTSLYIQNIVIEYKLGSGKFGDVFKGTWNNTTAVALKKLKNESGTAKEFENEVAMLTKLNHPNVVRFFGLYSHIEHGVLLVMECMIKGSLSDFLCNPDNKSKLNIKDLVGLAINVAAGMLYLEQKNIVHRDLGARNLLVTEIDGSYTAKIADLGLSRELYSDYYNSTEAFFPVKWSPPEVIMHRHFTLKSDVWSFAVTLWELFEEGTMPYPTMSNQETLAEVLKGYRLPKPEKCPDVIYELMLKCWSDAPVYRPTFTEIYQELSAVDGGMGGPSVVTIPVVSDAVGASPYNVTEFNHVTPSAAQTVDKYTITDHNNVANRNRPSSVIGYTTTEYHHVRGASNNV